MIVGTARVSDQIVKNFIVSFRLLLARLLKVWSIRGVGSIFLRCIYPNACFEYYIEQFGVNKIFYSEMMIIVWEFWEHSVLYKTPLYPRVTIFLTVLYAGYEITINNVIFVTLRSFPSTECYLSFYQTRMYGNTIKILKTQIQQLEIYVLQGYDLYQKTNNQTRRVS